MTLRTIGRKLQPSRHHRLTVAPKTVDRELSTPEHKAWRLIVCRRAGWRCEWIEQGLRCPKSAANGDRMTADHIVERRDGGALHDPAMVNACASLITPRRESPRGQRVAAAGKGG